MTAEDLELGTLCNHLWESANILRGPVDAADFKTYIFSLLFFKRFSDVFDEEMEAALEESGGDQQYALFPENHHFQIPDDCHWDDVRKKTTNVGNALQRAMREIEKANPETLYGIFGDFEAGSRRRSGRKPDSTRSSARPRQSGAAQGGRLTLHEEGLLSERKVRLKDGQFVLTDSLEMTRLEDRILFLHRRFSGKPLDRDSSWWSELGASMKLRNQLTHPKSATELSEREVERSLQAIIDTLNAMFLGIYKRPLPVAARGLQSKMTF